jgi:3-hydroxyisobutyrate dehydrogenase-like beta-hydroxyacid dehydrogenase
VPKKAVKTIGVIGLGKMGLPIARHLVKKRFAVVGCDVNPVALKRARALGARVEKTPAGVASACDLVIVLVGFDTEVDRALFAADGILAGAKPGLIVVVASTVAPAYMRGLAARAKGWKLTFIDAPLCRGEPAAEAGKLLIMGGGDKAAFEACRPVFSAFSDAIHYLGKLGAGQVGKMVNNLILWGCSSANYEGLKLASSLGVDEERLRQALLQSSARNWALEMWRSFGLMPWAEKDMTIVLQEADEARISLPCCGTVKEVIKGLKIERGYAMPKAQKV